MTFSQKIKNIGQCIIPMCMGFVVFSPFITTLSLRILHLPLAVPELFFLLFLSFQTKKFSLIKFDKKLWQKGLFCIILLFVFSLAWGEYSIGGIVSVTRSYVYILLFYCIFKNNSSVDNDYIMWVSLGSLLGWYYDSSINFSRLIVDLSAENVTYGLFLAVPLFLTISFYKRRNILLAVGVGVMIMISIYAGIRRIILVFLVSLVVVSLFQLLGGSRRIFRVFLLAALLVLLYLTFMSQIESFILDASPQLYHRMFVRTEEALAGNATGGDMLRYHNLENLTNISLESLIPHGFYTNHTSEGNGAAGIYNDLPVSGLIWALGYPLALFLLGKLIVDFISAVKNYVKGRCQESMPFLVSFVIMLLLLFLDGSFIIFCYAAPITGLCLGKISYYSKTHSYASFKQS